MKKHTILLLLGLFRKQKLKNLANSQCLLVSEIKKVQNRKFLSLINHCKKNVPYYKKINGLNEVKSLSDITKLPFLTKKIIKENFNDLRATNSIKNILFPIQLVVQLGRY